jgi:glyoxylase-like metal-dependent hydrolase (beta-lactamase superfamily II)
MEKNLTSQGVKMFTGGDLATNAYLIPCPQGNLLIDAPEGAAAAFADDRIAVLLLTHGHFDHVWDAAAIARIHGCRVAMHPVTEEMLADRNLLRRLGLDIEVEPVAADLKLNEQKHLELLGRDFELLEVPGHCPGSLCLHDPAAGTLYGGDVLFRGGVGRWDLPGGDRDLLLSGIAGKLLPLPSETVVLPGHGPETTIGHEKLSNPYLMEGSS